MMSPQRQGAVNIPLYLVGYRCTGKSTVGKILADLLERPFLDTDQIIETKFNTTITEMVDQQGWACFRQREKEALLDTAGCPSPVVATGGGIVLDPENRLFIQRQGICVWLWADTVTLVKRLRGDPGSLDSRPGLTDLSLAQETQKMLDLRTPLYQQLAHFKIDTTCHSPEQAATRIKGRFFHVRK